MSKVNTRKIFAYGLIAVLLIYVLSMILPNMLPSGNNHDNPSDVTAPVTNSVPVPTFSGDSAFAHVKKQVDFGPRVPGSPAHKACASWLVTTFKNYGMEVIEQPFVAKTYFGPLDAVNIIAQYKPELPNRILICSHWDSRHIASKDTKDADKPIDGADDGASGVGVMLEIARMLQQNPVEFGIDLICFDAEDLGDETDEDPSGSMMQNQAHKAETWCLGSQYWGRNIHKAGYSAQFGILLDMVGASGAKFPREGYSVQNAPIIVNKVWGVAAELGYSELFVNIAAGGITDDHYFVMRATNIPTVDIIGMPEPGPMFGKHHHTHLDNINLIDTEVLRKVGNVLATVIYREAARQAQ
ncbi:MAG: M28 family peptidase [Lewinellaceae bacterium]|nr:M28 family peptidase [Lewinellaceae bacterium]